MKCCVSAGIVLQELFNKDSRKHGTDTTRSNLKHLNTREIYVL